MSVRFTGDRISLVLPQLRRSALGERGAASAFCCYRRRAMDMMMESLDKLSVLSSLPEAEFCQTLSSSPLLSQFLPDTPHINWGLGALITPTLLPHAGPAIRLIYAISKPSQLRLIVIACLEGLLLPSQEWTTIATSSVHQTLPTSSTPCRQIC